MLKDVSIVTISAGEQRRRFSILDFRIRSEKTPIMKKLCNAKVQALVDSSSRGSLRHFQLSIGDEEVVNFSSAVPKGLLSPQPDLDKTTS